MKRIGFLTLSLLMPGLLLAQETTGKRDLSTDQMMMTAAIAMAAFTVLLIFVIILLLLKLKTKLASLLPQSEEDILYQKQDFWSKVFQLRPLTVEHKLVMDHSYDGIQELDNPTPPWFMFLFYSTIFFAVCYGLIYHVMGNGKIMENEYTAEIKDAEVSREAYLKKFANSVNESNVTLVTAKEKLADGKKVYTDFCVACHGKQGEGQVGPNLTDDYWLHGNGIKKVFHTIAEGVPEKGMIAWNKQLNPLQIQMVASYIISLKGTKPANPKAPQGVIEGGEKTATDSSTTGPGLSDTTTKIP